MFRRHHSGLPKDANFPADLEKLGYFVNEIDEIRSIENPDYYFKYFLNKNQRVNQRQRFAFNHALETIIHQRLENEGLQKHRLPLGTPYLKPHVPFFSEPDLKAKKRIVIFFGETTQDLGLLAGRIANGHGGIDKGSMVSVVKQIRNQCSTPNDGRPPGIILANMGQILWWPEGQRALTVAGMMATPLPSLVHAGNRHDPEVNEIKGQEKQEDHVRSIFEVVSQWADDDAVIDIVTISSITSEVVEKFLDENWAAWGHRLSSMVFIETFYRVEFLQNQDLKNFLAKRARCYMVSPAPVDTPLATIHGNPRRGIPALGMPVYSSAELEYGECILVTALDAILSYLHTNALDPNSENAWFEVFNEPTDDAPTQEEIEQSWDEVDDSEKPMVALMNQEIMQERVRQLKQWKRFEKTGIASAFDSDSDDDDTVTQDTYSQAENDAW